jgi:thiamine biosynthesis lipoprotein
MTTQSSFQALGTTVVVAVTDASRLAVARVAVAEFIDELDRVCSRFREDSELSALNAAAGAPVEASQLLLDAVAAALRAASLTDGDVDPTVGEVLLALGYDRDFTALGPRPAPSIARIAGWRAVVLDRAAGTVRIPDGVSLDLGATAKALGADRAAARAFEAAGCGVLVSLGGDIALGGPAPDRGWRVRVTDDHRAGTEAPGQSITLCSGGLATSSTTARRWQAGDSDVHHLVDPSTARPTDGPWRTASVTAASCLDANIASTAAIVRGHRAVAWLESLGLPSRLVSVDGRVRHLAGWPADADDLELAA